MGMVLILICALMTLVSIASEKELGKMEVILVTPVGKFTFILANLIPYWLIGYVVLTICVGLAYFAWGITSAGFFGSLYIFVTIFYFSHFRIWTCDFQL